MTGKHDTGFTLIELLIVVAIISIIAVIALPNLTNARIQGYEASALTTMRVINTAEVGYSASCGNNGYAVSFEVLAAPSPVTGFISADLGVAVPEKSGYKFTLSPGLGSVAGPPDCNAVITQTAYYATAVPSGYGSTGNKSYATNALNLVYQLQAATAPTEPFGPPATPAR
jgi:type IV pilus assembly protein PilA